MLNEPTMHALFNLFCLHNLYYNHDTWVPPTSPGEISCVFSDMIFQNFILSKTSFTNIAFKFRLCWMNQQHMLTLISFALIICIPILTLCQILRVWLNCNAINKIGSCVNLFISFVLFSVPFEVDAEPYFGLIVHGGGLFTKMETYYFGSEVWLMGTVEYILIFPFHVSG